jgi:hypothetical protein
VGERYSEWGEDVEGEYGDDTVAVRGPDSDLKCESCDIEIESGYYCDECYQ